MNFMVLFLNGWEFPFTSKKNSLLQFFFWQILSCFHSSGHFFIFYFYFLVKLEIKLKIVLVFLLLFVLAFCVLYLDFHELGFCYFIISPSSSLFIFFPCFRLCPCIGFQHLFFPFTNISILFIHARELGIKH